MSAFYYHLHKGNNYFGICRSIRFQNKNYFADVKKITAIMSNAMAVGYEDMLCIEGVILLRHVLLLVRVRQ